MIQSSRRDSSNKMLLEEQFRHLRSLTEEDFRRMDAARRRGQERDIELGFRLREDIEREVADRERDQVAVDAIRRQRIKGDQAFENLVEQAVCRNCVGLTDAIVWSTRVRATACGCPSPSDDEGAPPSPPQTPIHIADVSDDTVNTSRRQWLKERLLMELRECHRPEFEDYTCWQSAKIKFLQISTGPTTKIIHPKQPTKRSKSHRESIDNQICKLNRRVFPETYSLASDKRQVHSLPKLQGRIL